MSSPTRSSEPVRRLEGPGVQVLGSTKPTKGMDKFTEGMDKFTKGIHKFTKGTYKWVYKFTKGFYSFMVRVQGSRPINSIVVPLYGLYLESYTESQRGTTKEPVGKFTKRVSGF